MELSAAYQKNIDLIGVMKFYLFEETVGNGNLAAQSFTFRELAAAMKNFQLASLLGEGRFGRVYKDRLDVNK